MDKKPQALTDAGVGRALFTTHLQPTLHAPPVTGVPLESAQGAGSSIAVHELMSQVIKRGKSVIYDPCGEFFQAYSRPQKCTSPECDGSVTWSLLEGLRRDLDADCMANGFLPTGEHSFDGERAASDDLFGDADAEGKARKVEKAAESAPGFPQPAAPAAHGPVDSSIPCRISEGGGGTEGTAQTRLYSMPRERT